MALILITYVSAGLSLNTAHDAAVLGIPVTVRRPNLVILGLIIAALYGTARYVYYAFLHRRSPRKCRKRFMRNFEPTPQPGVYRATSALTLSQIEILKSELTGVFPELPHVKPIIPIGHEPPDPDHRVMLFVPPEITKASWFEDFDYLAPVWLNAVALPLAILSAVGILPQIH